MISSLIRRWTVGRDTRDTRWITRTVALLAIVVFAVSGVQIGPALVGAAGHGHTLSPEHITAFLLNIALVLFAWRRSVQLQVTAAQRDAAEDQVHQLAYYDELTGLLNRRRLMDLLPDLCATHSGKCALVLIDLDHFKRINDLHGHSAGDRVLKVMATRIREAIPLESSCFRLGGDEFAVLLYGPDADPARAKELGNSLLEALLAPISVANTMVAIAASIGISFISRKCSKPAAVVECADLAMYEAKRLGRNRCIAFDKGLERQVAARKRIEEELRAGLANGEFHPYFQPIFDLATGQAVGFEVLARWQHPVRGLLEPAEFIGLAERTGMISDLSFGVMHEALTIARHWPSRLKISVNISPVQFSDPLVAQRILRVLSQAGFPAQRLEVEIMEKSLLDDPQVALTVVTSLQNSGISVSVDDFGAGYGTLAQLRTLPFDRIKIDRTFIASLLDDDRCDALVEALATLGKGLKIPITAEGVEAEAVKERLHELGCTDAQGWVFAAALSAREVALGFGREWQDELPKALQSSGDEGPARVAGGNA